MGTSHDRDPSGRSAERLLLSRSAVEENIVGIQSQLTRFIDFEGPNGAELVDTVQTVDCSNRRVHRALSCRRAAEPLGLAPLSARLWLRSARCRRLTRTRPRGSVSSPSCRSPRSIRVRCDSANGEQCLTSRIVVPSWIAEIRLRDDGFVSSHGRRRRDDDPIRSSREPRLTRPAGVRSSLLW